MLGCKGLRNWTIVSLVYLTEANSCSEVFALVWSEVQPTFVFRIPVCWDTPGKTISSVDNNVPRNNTAHIYVNCAYVPLKSTHVRRIVSRIYRMTSSCSRVAQRLKCPHHETREEKITIWVHKPKANPITFKKAWNLGISRSHLTTVSLVISK